MTNRTPPPPNVSARQTMENLKGEVAFRAKLARQHTTGEILLPDYYPKDEHDAVLAERIETTRSTFELMGSEGTDFSHYVELGAERGHRSLVLQNSFGAEGLALDLSWHQLRTCRHFSELFRLPKLPLRICCDAMNLPIRSEAVPFLFCYQFLHHFPALGGVVGEIRRTVAPGGMFFFDEEPLGRRLQWHLYRQSAKEYAARNRNRPKLLRWLEGFISDVDSDEVEHGVIENHGMRLDEWWAALEGFDERELRLRTLRYLRTRVRRGPGWLHVANDLLGGVVSGVCRRIDAPFSQTNPSDWLICPECRSAARGEFAVVREGEAYICSGCASRFPIADEVAILMVGTLRRELYPEFG